MRYEGPKQALRRRIRSPRTWSALRRLLVTYEYYARRPDESEIRYFSALSELPEPNLLFVDVGASGGQTAVGIARVLPTARIVSFEANPTLGPELAWVRRLIGQRYEYFTCGLGSQPGVATLYVPYVDDLPVTTRASLSSEVAAARADELGPETQRSSWVRPLQVEVRRFDDLGLVPHGVKIDVEGLELDVLRGMTETLEHGRPMLMLEYNEQTSACRELLRSFGYDCWDVDTESGALVPAGTPAIRNWFAIPPDPALRAALALTS